MTKYEKESEEQIVHLEFLIDFIKSFIYFKIYINILTSIIKHLKIYVHVLV